MEHPELLKKMGKTKNREPLGLYQCPFCENTFSARIDQVFNEHTTSCGCRKKQNFKLKLERQIKAKTTREQRIQLYGEYRDRGADKAYLCKKFGIRPSEYSIALRIAEMEFYQPVPPRRISEGQWINEANAAPTSRQSAAVVQRVTTEPISNRPLVQPVAQTIIVQSGGKLTMNQHSSDKLLVEPLFINTEEGFCAQQGFFQQFHRLATSNDELVTWNEQRKTN